MREFLGQYYGLDWIAMATSLLFIYYIADKKRFGFLFGLASAITWTAVNVMASIWPGVFLNLVLIALHTRGYMKWKPDAENPETTTVKTE
jgi:nicotinamide riboside transporter PnuC